MEFSWTFKHPQNGRKQEYKKIKEPLFTVTEKNDVFLNFIRSYSCKLFHTYNVCLITSFVCILYAT